MEQYKALLQHVLDNGKIRNDRTGTGTLGVFGYQMRFDLQRGFPLLTTKKTSLRIIFEELKWFLRGETNIISLLEKNVHIWDKDAFRWYKEKVGLETAEKVIEGFRKEYEFSDEVEDHEVFAKMLLDGKIDSKYGDLGNIYGKQWRSWAGEVDQIFEVIEGIKQDPFGRRHIVTAWNPKERKSMALPPCHVLLQLYVEEGKLSGQLYQRSGDIFLGVGFNIASYALLITFIAAEAGLEVGEFVHTLGDAHIYLNHIEQVKEQLSREERALPQLIIKNKRDHVWDYEWEDIELIGYDPHPSIKGVMST